MPMTIVQASETLRDILDVTDQRYPPGVRTAHINQAIQALGRRFETAYNEGIGQYLLEAGYTSFAISEIEDEAGAPIVPEIVEAIYYTFDYDPGVIITPGPAGTNSRSLNSATATGAWEKMQIYSSYEALMDVALNQDSELYGATQHGAGTLYIMNAQEEDMLMRILFNGPHQETTTQNSWLIYAPYPVIYQAAIYGLIYMENEEKIPAYTRLLEESVEVVNIADSMRNDAPMSMQEA